MTWNQKFMSSLKWSVGARGISQTISWIATIYVIRQLVPSDYGVVAIAMVVIDFSIIAAEFGLIPALIQKEKIDSEFVGVAYGFTLLSGILIALACFLAAPWFALWFSNTVLTNIIRAFSLQFVIAAFGAVYYALLQREMRFKEISTIQLLSNTTAGVLSFVLAYNDFGVWTLVIAPLTGLAIENIGYYIVTKEKISPRWNKVILYAEIKFGRDIFFQKLISKLNGQVDTIFIGKFMDVALLGGYTTSKQLVSIPVSKIMPILNGLMFPMFSRIQDQPHLVRDAYLNILDALVFLLVLMLWGLAATADIAIPLLLGSQWVGIEPIVIVISILAPFTVIYYTTASIFYATGESKAALLMTIINLFAVVLAISIAKEFGIFWVAFGVSAAYISTSLLSIMKLIKIIGLKLGNVIRMLAQNIACGLVLIFVVKVISNYAGDMAKVSLLCVEAFCGAIGMFVARELILPGSLLRIKNIVQSKK